MIIIFTLSKEKNYKTWHTCVKKYTCLPAFSCYEFFEQFHKLMYLNSAWARKISGNRKLCLCV